MLHLSILSLVLLTNSPSEEASWKWRGGPHRDFRLHDSSNLTETFGEWSPTELWRRPLGDGYSGLLFDGGRLFAHYHDEGEEVVSALSAADGESLWEFRYPVEPYSEMDEAYGLGPNATPAILGNRIFSVSIDGQMHCLRTDSGELEWRLDLHERYGRQARKEEYGFSASPVIFEEMVLVLVGGDQHGVVALEPSDGSQIWGSPPSRISYAQATLVDLEDEIQLVFFSPTAVIGLDPWIGDFVWQFPVENVYQNNLTPALYLGDRHLWVASQIDGGTRVLKIPTSEDSDKEPESGAIEPEVLWSSKTLKQAHWDSFRIGDYVYGSLGGNSSSFLAGVNWKTGEVAWKHRGFHLAKGVLADGKFYFLDENGQIGIARFSPTGVDILSAHQLTERVSWTPPIVVGSALYARDRKSLVAVDLAAESYSESN